MIISYSKYDVEVARLVYGKEDKMAYIEMSLLPSGMLLEKAKIMANNDVALRLKGELVIILGLRVQEINYPQYLRRDECPIA